MVSHLERLDVNATKLRSYAGDMKTYKGRLESSRRELEAVDKALANLRGVSAVEDAVRALQTRKVNYEREIVGYEKEIDICRTAMGKLYRENHKIVLNGLDKPDIKKSRDEYDKGVLQLDFPVLYQKMVEQGAGKSHRQEYRWSGREPFEIAAQGLPRQIANEIAAAGVFDIKGVRSRFRGKDVDRAIEALVRDGFLLDAQTEPYANGNGHNGNGHVSDVLSTTVPLVPVEQNGRNGDICSNSWGNVPAARRSERLHIREILKPGKVWIEGIGIVDEKDAGDAVRTYRKDNARS